MQSKRLINGCTFVNQGCLVLVNSAASASVQSSKLRLMSAPLRDSTAAVGERWQQTQTVTTCSFLRCDSKGAFCSSSQGLPSVSTMIVVPT